MLNYFNFKKHAKLFVAAGAIYRRMESLVGTNHVDFMLANQDMMWNCRVYPVELISVKSIRSHLDLSTSQNYSTTLPCLFNTQKCCGSYIVLSRRKFCYKTRLLASLMRITRNINYLACEPMLRSTSQPLS
jgi:hypothetical protein